MRESVFGQLTGTEESKENQTRWIFKDAMVEDLEASKIKSNPPSPLVFDRPFSQTRDVCAEKRQTMNSLFFLAFSCFLIGSAALI